VYYNIFVDIVSSRSFSRPWLLAYTHEILVDLIILILLSLSQNLSISVFLFKFYTTCVKHDPPSLLCLPSRTKPARGLAMLLVGIRYYFIRSLYLLYYILSNFDDASLQVARRCFFANMFVNLRRRRYLHPSMRSMRQDFRRPFLIWLRAAAAGCKWRNRGPLF